MEIDTRFPTKLNAISDAPEPLRSALVESFPSEKPLRLLVHAPAFSTVGEKTQAIELVGFTQYFWHQSDSLSQSLDMMQKSEQETPKFIKRNWFPCSGSPEWHFENDNFC